MEITLDLYREHREALLGLNTKLVGSLGPELVMESARMLGLVQRNTIVADSQEQMNVVMDMAIHESIHGEETGFQRFAASYVATNETEAAVLNAMHHNTCSLFEIVEVYPNEHRLVCRDLLDGEGKEFLLIDVNYSKTARVGTVVFTRILPLEQFSMTAGSAMTFSGSLKEFLLRRYKKVMKKIYSSDEATRRYIAFHTLYRSEGSATVFR